MPPSASPSPASPATSGGPPWWHGAFGALYLTVYARRGDEEARRLAPSIARLLGIRVNGRILDVACGEGRYARALSAAGYRVTGVDVSADLLAEARKRSPGLPGEPTYLRVDMRQLPFEEQFDAAVLLFTSYGYFEDRTEDARVLEGIRRALVPGGRFLLDFLNATQVRERLVAHDEEVRGHWHVAADRRIDEETEHGPYVRKRVVVTDLATGHVEGDWEERVRLYEPDELDDAIRAAGLDLLGDRLGDLDGRPWTADAPRVVRLASRRRAVPPPRLPLS
jgi:SAM-dependent methyltransferase